MVSRGWYWWQALVAIVLGVYHEARHSKLLAVRCVVAGGVLAVIFSELLQRLLVPHSIVTSLRFASPVFSTLLIAACAASIHLAKWMGRFHGHYRRAFVVLYVTSFCSVLYACWLTTLFTVEPARTNGHVILGGIVNYFWVVGALIGSGLLVKRTQ